MAESDSLRLTSIFLSALVRICITTTRLPSIGFERLLPTQRDVEKLFLVPGLSIAPGLFTVLRARDPPTLAWFKGLPFCETSKDWAVYTLILEKPNSKPLLYIGSATSRLQGLKHRMVAYRSQSSRLPRYLAQALKEGFKITCKGVLLTMPRPEPVEVQLHRHFMFALEATLSFAFWAMYSKETDYKMGHLCKWDIETLEWYGLCSHSALYDWMVLETQELDMTPKEIEIREREKKDHALRRERERHHESVRTRRYVCTICDKAFGATNALTVHIAAHSGKRDFLCTSCPGSFNSPGALSTHRSRQHNASANLTCVVCGSRYSSTFTLLAHQRLLHSIVLPTVYECTDCDQKFKAKAYLTAHRKTVHAPSPQQFTCSICNKEFGSEVKLARHIESVHNPSRPKFSCTGCDRDFVSKRALDRHYAKRHISNTHTCTFCNNKYPKRRNLVAHIKFCHSESPTRYPCSHCGKVYTTKRGCDQHFNQKHGQEPPKLACKFCDAKYHLYGNLEYHMKTHHSK